MVAPTNSARMPAAQVVQAAPGQATRTGRRFRALEQGRRPGGGLRPPARRGSGGRRGGERVLVHDGLDALGGRRSCRGTWRRRGQQHPSAGPVPPGGHHVDAPATAHAVRPASGRAARARRAGRQPSSSDGASGPYHRIGTCPTASTLVTIAPPAFQPAHTPVSASSGRAGAVVGERRPRGGVGHVPGVAPVELGRVARDQERAPGRSSSSW